MNDFFPITRITVLKNACREDTIGAKAMENFADLYYQPVLAYFSVLLRNFHEDPREHTNQFFLSKILSRHLLVAVRPELGTFRHFLKRAISNYCRDQFRRARRQTKKELPLNTADGQVHDREVNPWPEIEAAFHEAWVRSLLQRTVERVEKSCKMNDQQVHFALFVAYYASAGKRKSWSELGAAHGLDQRTARSRAETVTRKLEPELRAILAEDAGNDEMVDEELAALRAILESMK